MTRVREMNPEGRETAEKDSGGSGGDMMVDGVNLHRPSTATTTTKRRTNSESPRKDNNNTSNLMSNDSDGNNELDDESTNLIGTGLRRRKGKIISCAKETIENGE